MGPLELGGDMYVAGRGGLGGGVVVIRARGSITISGQIISNGANGTAASNLGSTGYYRSPAGGGGGGGAGGGIYIYAAESVLVTGSLSANGGNGGNGAAALGLAYDGGGGGGGIVQIVSPSVEVAGTISVNGGTGQTNGSPGVVRVIERSLSKFERGERVRLR